MLRNVAREQSIEQNQKMCKEKKENEETAPEKSNTSSEEDRSYVTRMGIMGNITWIGLASCGYFLPTAYPLVEKFEDRLKLVITWGMFSSLPLLFGVINVARTRLRSAAINPLDETQAHIVALGVKFLQNTLEQFVLHFVALLALAITIQPENSRMIVVFSCIFVLARLSFWIGYKRYYLARAFGFSMTLQPTIFLFAYCIIRQFI